MSKDSIRTALEKDGTFPEKAIVSANFEMLFAMSEANQETIADLALGFMQALDQWSHVDAVVDPALAEALRQWTFSHWDLSSYELCKRLSAILKNVANPQVVKFLKSQHDQCTNPDIKAVLSGTI